MLSSPGWDDNVYEIENISPGFEIFGSPMTKVFVHSNGQIYFNQNPLQIVPGSQYIRLNAFNVDFKDRTSFNLDNPTPSLISYDYIYDDQDTILIVDFAHLAHFNDSLADINFQVSFYYANDSISISLGELSTLRTGIDNADKFSSFGVSQRSQIGPWNPYVSAFFVFNHTDFSGRFNDFVISNMTNVLQISEWKIVDWPSSNSSFSLYQKESYVVSNQKELNPITHQEEYKENYGAAIGKNIEGFKGWIEYYENTKPLQIAKLKVDALIEENQEVCAVLYNTDNEGKPTTLIYRECKSSDCLKDGYFDFTEQIELDSHYFAGIEVPNYKYENQVFGIDFTEIDSDTIDYGIARAVENLDGIYFQAFDNNWYNVYDNSLISRNKEYNAIHLGITPVISAKSDVIVKQENCPLPITSLNDLLNDQNLNIYPNPVKVGTELTITSKNLSKAEIWTSDGIKLQQHIEHKIIIKNLDPNIYFIKVFFNDGTYVVKKILAF